MAMKRRPKAMADIIEGNANNNTIYGGAGDQNIFGYAGDDTLYGGDGGDILVGGADNDTLYGGNGNDKLRPWQGSDILWGGSGDDIFDIDSNLPNGEAGYNYVMDMKPGDDKIVVYHHQLADTLSWNNTDAFKFIVGTKSDAPNVGQHTIIYNPGNDKLFYDGDGKNGDGAKLVCFLYGTNLQNLDKTNFELDL